MKKYFFIASMLIAMVMVSCKENPYINAPGDNSKNYDSIPVFKADTNGIEVDVDSAYVIGSKLTNGASTAETYKLVGTISSILTNMDDVPSKYTNVNFDINDGGKKSLRCQYTNSINNMPFKNKSEMPPVGSKVVVVGPLSNYNGSPQMKNGFIVRVIERAQEQAAD
ncbi:MAG: hypothetical protein IKP02_08145 [Paludibacteraceae bacterium]|jgi:hypothetical protein|nr:hypothetical protein [Paludibacteraceae bacterium]